MPKVTDKHEEYIERAPQYVRQRDAIEGEDAIKAKGEEYLPRLDGQTPETGANLQIAGDTRLPISSYSSYKQRATFLDATCRTRDALVGAIMRKDPELNWPASLKDFLEVTGKCGESFDEIISVTLDEVVGIGRYGHLVDMPKEEEGEPFIATYLAENILDWDYVILKGRKVTSYVNLQESYKTTDEEGREVKRIRHRLLYLGVPSPGNDQKSMGTYLTELDMSEADFAEGFVYYQEVWDEQRKPNAAGGYDTEFVRTDVIVPRLPGGVLLREIPFTFYNPTSTAGKPEKPPLMGLTVLNLSHYRNSADLEHGLHYTALPQPWAAGFKFSSQLFIGSSAAWVTEEPQAHCGYLEFSGAGLSSLKARMDDKKKEMAAHGARLLEEPQPAGGAEATATVELRQAGERSVLAKIAIQVSKGLSRTLKFLAQFKAVAAVDKIGIKLNTDFGVAGMTPGMLQALMQQVQAGYMSWNTYFWLAKRGELFPQDITEEQEAIRIEAGPPEAPKPAAPPGFGEDQNMDPSMMEEEPEEDEEEPDEDEEEEEPEEEPEKKKAKPKAKPKSS